VRRHVCNLVERGWSAPSVVPTAAWGPFARTLVATQSTRGGWLPADPDPIDRVLERGFFQALPGW